MNHCQGSVYCICLLFISASVFAEQITGTVPPHLHQGQHIVRIDDSDLLTLVERGKANVEIVVITRSPLLRYAAEELQTFIAKATGAKVEIVNRRSGMIPAIVLGDNLWARQAAGIDVGKLPRDGFRIKRTKDVIYIAGRDDPYADPKRLLTRSIAHFEKATLFGVYDFLERFVGVRFYFPGDIGTVVPKTDTLRIPLVDISEAPDFFTRKISYSGIDWGGTSDKDASRVFSSLGQMRWRGQTSYVPNCHSMARCGLSRRFADTNPEYFALLPNGKRDSDLSLPGHPGQHCFSSKGLEDEVYKDGVAFLTGKPASARNVITSRGISWWDASAFRPGYFNIMPNDGYGPRNYCRCKGCWPYLGNGKASELIWGFVARVAKRLQQDGYPGYVTGMVYSGYRAVPEFEIPDNVLVMVALMGPWKDKYPEFQAADDKSAIDWSKKIGKKIWMWNYINAYGSKIPPGVPAISTKCIASYYKRMAPHMFGAYVQSDTDYALFHYLNYYVIHKLFWNNDTDVDALVNEYQQKLFGPAAGPMGVFFARLEDIWMNQLLGEFKSTARGPVMVKHTEVEVWEQVYTDEVFGQLEALYDEAEKLARNDPDSLTRVRWFRKHFLGKMLSVKEEYKAKKREVEDLVWQVTPLPKGSKVVVDGKLNDAAWKGAQSVVLVPLQGDVALVKTIVSARWTADTLYLAYDCREPKIDRMYLSRRKRDDNQVWQDSSAEIFLNPSGDRTTYFQYIVSANGAVADLKISTDDQGVKKYDWEWNANIRAVSHIGKDGWMSEIAIPLKEIASANVKAGTRFVANFSRGRNLTGVTKEENQLYTWSPFLRRGFHDLQRFGSIEFVDRARADTSRIKNGSFEKIESENRAADWPYPKDPEQRERIALDETTHRHGERSLRMSDAVGKLAVGSQTLKTIKPNTRYQLTYFIKLKDVDRRGDADRFGACVNLFISGKDGQNLFFPDVLHTGTLDWSKQGVIFKTGPNTGQGTAPYVRLYLYNSEGSVWFDAVRLRELD
ncbi:MAG: DUF4838 domain-containing protein [Planctomycetota bacterium]|jgi:hypothetical protein|nr:DUF4838 domain-containing protein [Planctomycetota bacterium]